MKYCKDCRHVRPFPSKWIWLIPIFGITLWVIERIRGADYWSLAKCAVSYGPKDKYDFMTGATLPKNQKYASHSREFGPRGEAADMFEARK